MPSRPGKELDFWKLAMYYEVAITGDYTINPSDYVRDAKYMPITVLDELYG